MHIRDYLPSWAISRTYWADCIIAGLVLLVLLAILLTPTIQTVRSIESESKHLPPLSLAPGQTLKDTVAPTDEAIDYVLIWVKDEHNGALLKPSDYAGLQLQIISPTGEVLRQATNATFLKREYKNALKFSFPTLDAHGQYLTFVLQQMGEGTVWVEPPITDQVHSDEAVTTSIQLAKRANWITLLVHKVYDSNFEDGDIAMYLYRGQEIMRGENPYACIPECVGYPAHLPGIYLVAAGAVALGVHDIAGWGAVWRPIAFASWIAVGLVLFVYLFRRRHPALASAALGFWLFNRWSIDVLRIAHTDFLGTLFLVLSAILADSSPFVAAFLLGISLSIKQVGAFVVPLFLLYIWRVKRVGVRGLLIAIGLLAAVPLAVGLPFLLDNPSATLAGWFDAFSRTAQVVHGFAPSLDTWLDVTHAGRSSLMFAIIAAVYIAAWKKNVNVITGSLFILATMIAFTHVLYNQYLVWMLPFIPLAAPALLARPARANGEKNGYIKVK